MRIAVISDIHGNGYALNQVLGHAKKQRIDRYIFLGDYITDGPNVNSILNKIREIGDVVLAGNREEYIMDYHNHRDDTWENTLQYQGLYYTYQRVKSDNLNYLFTLPIMAEITIEETKIVLYHGIPKKARQVFVPMREQEYVSKLIEEYDADIYIGGHTHIAYSHEQEDRYFFNPGSVGVPIRSNGINYGILEVNDGKVHWDQITIPYNRTDMIGALKVNKELYLRSVGFWSDLYFQALQTNRDVVFDFLRIAYDLAGIKPAIGETRDIDNETFKKAIQEYKKKTQ